MVLESMEATMVDTYDAAYWRRRARETRSLAEGMGDPETKRAMLKLAATYDWMAECSDKGPAPPTGSPNVQKRSA